jgi:DNA-binding CsgD family transcriptional regulator
MQKIEVIKRKTGLKSRSSIVKWALARAYQFAKDERGG